MNSPPRPPPPGNAPDINQQRRYAIQEHRAHQQVPAAVPLGLLPPRSPPVMARPTRPSSTSANKSPKTRTRHGGKKSKTNKRRHRKSSKRV
jgi:hypothetical protein